MVYSILYHICFLIYYLPLLFSDLLFQKPKYTLLKFLVIYFISCFREIYLSNLLQTNLSFTREGLTTPLTHRVASICSLYEGTVYIVLLCSPTGSRNLVSSLREIPTVAVLHHPFLFGEILMWTRAICCQSNHTWRLNICSKVISTTVV